MKKKQFNTNSKRRIKFLRKLLIKCTIREKHLRGTLAHRIFGDYIFSKHFWIPHKFPVAKGVAIGLFFGLLPIFGLQIISAITIALFLRANITAAILLTWVTNPITFPIVLWLEKQFGDLIISSSIWKCSHIHINMNSYYFTKYGEPLLVGSIMSGIIISISGFFLTVLLWDSIALIAKQINHKIKRTNFND